MDDSSKTTQVKIVEQDEPVPVVIADTAQPLPVKVMAENHDPHISKQTISTYAPPATTVEKGQGLTASPTSTEEEDRHSASQRQINRYWERVQGYIAVLVTTTSCAISLILVWRGEYALGVGLISSMVFLVIGFYFGRSNHERVGGVQLPMYQGR